MNGSAALVVVIAVADGLLGMALGLFVSAFAATDVTTNITVNGKMPSSGAPIRSNVAGKRSYT
jgi:hypothetical protein